MRYAQHNRRENEWRNNHFNESQKYLGDELQFLRKLGKHYPYRNAKNHGDKNPIGKTYFFEKIHISDFGKYKKKEAREAP